MIRLSYDISTLKGRLLNLKSELQGLGKPIVKTTITPHRCRGSHSLDRVSDSIRIPSCADDILQANSIFYRTAWFRHCHILVSETPYIRKMFYSRTLLTGKTPSDTRVGVLVTTTNVNLVKPGELV